MRRPRRAARWSALALGAATHVALAQTPPAGPASSEPTADGQRPSVELATGVRASQSYSTNALRRPSGQERDGIVTEVTPYLRTLVNGPRLQADLDLAIRNFFRTETAAGVDAVDTLRYALSGRVRYTAPGGRFGVLGTGLVRDVNVSPFSIVSDDPSLVPLNRQRYSAFSVAPYLTGHFGTIADYRAEVSSNATQVTGGGNLVARSDNRLTGMLNSVPGFGPWTWSVQGTRQHRDFGTGFTMGRSDVTMVSRYAILPELRAGVSANYAQIDRLRNSDGQDNGWGPGLEIDWAPSARTRLQASWADMYYGPTTRFDLTHRLERLSFGLRHTRTMMTSSDASVLLFDPSPLFGGSAGGGSINPVYQALLDQRLLDRGPSLIGSGIVTDAATLMHQTYATVGYSSPRGSVLFSAYRNLRERTVANQAADVTLNAFTGDILQRGITVAADYALAPANTVRLSARRVKSDSDTSNLHTELTVLQAGYEIRFSTHATAGMGLRRTLQKSANSSTDYRDSTLFGTLDVKF